MQPDPAAARVYFPLLHAQVFGHPVFCPVYRLNAILVIASAADVPAPRWGGYLDVDVVVAIAVTGIATYQRSKELPRYNMSYHTTVYLVPLILVSMWIYRNALDFNILIPDVVSLWKTQP